MPSAPTGRPPGSAVDLPFARDRSAPKPVAFGTQASTAPRIGRQVLCTVCGEPVEFLKQAAGPTCGALACRHASDLYVRAERRKRAADTDRAAAAAWLLSSRGARADDPSSDVLGVVPSLSGKLAASDPERADEFLANLAAAAAAPAGCDEDEDFETAPPEEGGRNDLMAACGTCGGRCCNAGRTHAFLTAREVAWLRRRSPSLSVRQFVDLYAGYLPARSYEGSCVFHAEFGCALPRSGRSRVCNRFQCAGLEALAAEIAAHAPRHIHVAAVEDGQVRATVSIARDGSRLGAADPARLPPDAGRD